VGGLRLLKARAAVDNRVTNAHQSYSDLDISLRIQNVVRSSSHPKAKRLTRCMALSQMIFDEIKRIIVTDGLGRLQLLLLLADLHVRP